LASPVKVPAEKLICGGLFQEGHGHVCLSVHGHGERTTAGDFGDVDHADVPGEVGVRGDDIHEHVPRVAQKRLVNRLLPTSG